MQVNSPKLAKGLRNKTGKFLQVHFLSNMFTKQISTGSHQIHNVVVTAHALLMTFFMVMPAACDGSSCTHAWSAYCPHSGKNQLQHAVSTAWEGLTSTHLLIDTAVICEG